MFFDNNIIESTVCQPVIYFLPSAIDIYGRNVQGIEDDMLRPTKITTKFGY